MKKSDLRILEGQLSELPHIQQKHILNLLTQPLNSQTSSFIDCLTEVTTCCHCDGQKVKKWGGISRHSALQMHKRQLRQNL